MSDGQTMVPRRFLEKFFGEGNDLDLGNPGHAQALAPWIRRVSERNDRILLPRKQRGIVTWYALTDSSQTARALREELMSAVGPTYTDFLGVGATLRRSDPVEAAILEFSGRHAFKLTVVDPELTEACRRALERMLELHDGRPPGQARALRVPGLILRDFEFSLQQQDRETADDALEELRAGGHLDGQNLRFLGIRRKEVFHEWAAIIEEVEEGTVLELRRPARITQALLRAIYRTELLDLEKDVRASEALAHFDQNLFGTVASLLETREGMSAPEVAKLFMLKAAVLRDPRLRDSLLEGAGLRGADKVYLRALADLVRGPEQSRLPSQDEAVEAYLDGDKDRAFELLVAGRGGERRMGLLLRCALELGTLRVAEIALGVIGSASETERDELASDPRLACRLQELEARYTAPSTGVPSGWLDWVSMISDGLLDDNSAAELAQRGAEEWSLNDLIERPGDVVKLAQALIGVGGGGKRQLRLALPHLQGFLMSGEGTAPSLKPVLRSLLEFYALDDEARSGVTWRAAAEVLEELVRCGLSDEEYAEAVDSLELLLEGGLPLARVDEALDLLEALVILAPGQATTMRAAALLQGGLLRWRERLGRAHVDLFNQLGRELGMPVTLPLPEQERRGDASPRFDWLADKVVALYSLNERALARVRSVLESTAVGVRVLTFSDKVGGKPMLREAARIADVFLIVTGAAKHAATEFIEANRAADLVTLRSHGKGSASMLRLLGCSASEASCSDAGGF